VFGLSASKGSERGLREFGLNLRIRVEYSDI
jgi:hypothetical protein